MKGASRGARGDTVSVPFHYASAVGLVSGKSTISVSPNSLLSPRLTSIADDFDEYRFTRLRFRLHPLLSQAGPQALCYMPGIVDTPPSLAQSSEALSCVIFGQAATTPSAWVTVPAGVLAGMHPWYKTIPGTPEASEELQGNLFLAGTATDALFFEVEGVCQFRAAIATGNTPLDRALASRRREKQRIMSLLSATDQSLPRKT